MKKPFDSAGYSVTMKHGSKKSMIISSYALFSFLLPVFLHLVKTEKCDCVMWCSLFEIAFFCIDKSFGMYHIWAKRLELGNLILWIERKNAHFISNVLETYRSITFIIQLIRNFRHSFSYIERKSRNKTHFLISTLKTLTIRCNVQCCCAQHWCLSNFLITYESIHRMNKEPFNAITIRNASRFFNGIMQFLFVARLKFRWIFIQRIIRYSQH